MAKHPSIPAASRRFPALPFGARGSAALHSVGMKLFLLIFFSICLCVASGGIASFVISKQIIETKVSGASEQTIRQTGEKLDLVLRNFQEITDQLATDLVLQEQMSSLLADRQSSYTLFQIYAKLTERLRTYVMNNPMITDSYFIPVHDAVKRSLAATSSPVIGTSSIVVEQAIQAPWFQQAIEAQGSPVWISTTPTTPESASNTSQAGHTIGIARLLRSTADNADVFVLLLEIRLDDLAAQFRDVSLGEGGDVLMIDNDGRFVYSSDRTQIGQPSPSFMNVPTAGLSRAAPAPDEEWLLFAQPLTVSGWRLIGTVPVDELLKDTRLIRWTAWVSGGLAALLAIIVGWMAAQMVAVPLSRLRNLMREGKNGNLAVRTDIRSRDEIGQLAVSFNEMMANITSLVRQTTVSAEHVLGTADQLADAAKKTAAAAKEISLSTEEIAVGSGSLAREAEKGSDLTAHMESCLDQVVEARNEALVSAADAEQAGLRGTGYMEALVGKTEHTEQIVRQLADNVDRLHERTGSVQGILDMLEQFAKQTNILSLNASIEAARAGTAGKGFMIIAGEIRGLAERSRQSIDVIAETTQAIQTEIGETVQTLSDMLPLFREQAASVKEAGHAFSAVRNRMGQLTGRLETVAESIGLLTQAQIRLAETMSNVSAVAEQASAASGQVASASVGQLTISEGLVRHADRLEEVSGQLKQSLSRFTV